MKSPFKFLDSYTKDDREIFFGRDREIEELYQKVFDSKLLLVYGVSGTGKSSLINCGLANKFHDTDWLPLVVRRGSNMIESMAASVKAASITPQQNNFLSPADFRKGIRSLYLDHYKPVFFIFDQFEELFIFADKEERKSFIQIIKSLVESDLQCRLIFVMREEYMAGVTEFEKFIPTFFSNRVRIEKMSHVNALEAIKEPCKVFNINLDEGFAESLLEKLSPGGTEIELTYLQVFLDKIYYLAKGEKDQKSVIFKTSLLEKVGDVSDLLGSFLEQQIRDLDEPDTGLTILKTFVSVKGTKRQLTAGEAIKSSKSLGKKIPENIITDYLQKFVNLRILREKDENGKFELRHDSLATKIYEKITVVEKEMLEIYQFLENATLAYEKRKILLSTNDLKYIAPYEDRLFVGKEIENVIELSKKEHNKIKKRIKRVAISGFIAIVIFTIGAIFSTYHFPLSGPIRNLGLLIYILWFLPVFGYYVVKTKDNRTINMLFLIFTLLYVSNVYLNKVSTKNMLRALFFNPIAQNEEKLQEEIKKINLQTSSLYDSIYKVSEENLKLFPNSKEITLNLMNRTNTVVNYIQGLIIELTAKTEGKDSPAINRNEIDMYKMDRLEDISVPSAIMIGGNNNGKAFYLKALLNDYKLYLLGVVSYDPKISGNINFFLNTEDQMIKTSYRQSGRIERWEYINFETKPLGLVITQLTQIQTNIKNLEAQALTFLLSSMDTKLKSEK
jgi:hypothetical protein